MQDKSFSWKLYFSLLTASVVSITAVIPYAFTLGAEQLKLALIPLPLLVLISILQSALLFALVTFIGLKLASKTGLKLPLLENLLLKKNHPVNTKLIIKQSVFWGLIAGVVIIFVDYLFSVTGMSISLWNGESLALWMGFLASFYGGISEEILLRLFFMTFLVWLFSFFVKSEKRVIDRAGIMWTSIILASVIFGIGHLPITSSLTVLSPIVVARAIILNGIGGVVFGWLYWKKGLLSAMIAHFSADVVLHFLLPLFLIFF